MLLPSLAVDGDCRRLVAFVDHHASSLMLFQSSRDALPRGVVLGKELVPAAGAACFGDQLPGFGGRLDVARRDEAHHHQHSRKQF